MMVALTIAVIPVLHTAAGDQSGYYIGRTLWFGLICLYSLVIYVVQVPWHKIREEFNCLGNSTYPCLVECYEQLFSIPITGMWYYFYFIFIALFFLMEFFIAQIRHKHIKIKMKSMPQESENIAEMEKGSMEAIRKQSSSQVLFLNFHQEKKLLYLYLFHSLLQVSIQTVFLCLLTNKHLPIVSQGKTHCSTNSCATLHCLIRKTAEKRVTIYGLITLSIIIIFLGAGYFLYSIHHYLLQVQSASKIQIY
nr:uncharacterized protein LOC107402338 [Peromyscus maniculatus bairdii]XP_042129907.1 uncharacterized protein LOC107402338 [Peromyscus maniculatus bairdii]XP_042129908.1 uncharacterized protein LOC107402338 [Peromyscus maniculatus bairdii]